MNGECYDVYLMYMFISYHEQCTHVSPISLALQKVHLVHHLGHVHCSEIFLWESLGPRGWEISHCCQRYEHTSSFITLTHSSKSYRHLVSKKQHSSWYECVNMMINHRELQDSCFGTFTPSNRGSTHQNRIQFGRGYVYPDHAGVTEEGSQKTC